MADNISKIRNEILTEDEKMEIIANYLENGGGGGGSSKLRVKVKVDYVPTTAAEIQDTSETGMAGYIYTAATGVSFEDADGEPVSVEDVTAAAREGNIELIGIDHLGDTVMKNGDAVTVTPTTIGKTFLAASCAWGSNESEDGFMLSGQLWMAEVNLPFVITVTHGQVMAMVGVMYIQ